MSGYFISVNLPCKKKNAFLWRFSFWWLLRKLNSIKILSHLHLTFHSYGIRISTSNDNLSCLACLPDMSFRIRDLRSIFWVIWSKGERYWMPSNMVQNDTAHSDSRWKIFKKMMSFYIFTWTFESYIDRRFGFSLIHLSLWTFWCDVMASKLV